jgi:hypothetical protein
MSIGNIWVRRLEYRRKGMFQKLAASSMNMKVKGTQACMGGFDSVKLQISCDCRYLRMLCDVLSYANANKC